MKKIHFSDKRVIFGLISLLFVVGFIHTMSILRLSQSLASKTQPNSQKAQVATLGTCLQVTPWNNRITTYQNFNGSNLPGANIDMYWNVKNICPWNVRILRTPDITSSGPSNMELQLVSFMSQPFALAPSTFASHGITNYAEDVMCLNCSGDVTYTSTVVPGHPTVYTYLIPPQATRMVRYRTWFNKNPQYPYDIRVAPKSVKWVQENAWSDNTISANDIFNSAVSTANVTNWASDFINISN